MNQILVVGIAVFTYFEEGHFGELFNEVPAVLHRSAVISRTEELQFQELLEE